MPEDIFRSGVAHAVETNLVTRHAINPRHTFLETDPEAKRQAPELAATASAAQASDTSPSHAVVAADVLHDNIQSLAQKVLQDNWQKVDHTNPSNNLQAVSQDHRQDNLQTIPTDALSDNRQSRVARESIQEKKVYFEKKSIRDNVQKVADTALTRAVPQMPVLPQVASTSGPAVTSNAYARGDKTQLHQVPDEKIPSNAKAQEEDELRARMQKLKAKVRDVNHTLSDLDPKP